MKKRIIFIILGALAIIIGGLALLNRPEGQLDAAQLEIYLAGNLAATFTMDQVKALPAIELQKEIVSSSQENQSGLFTGVALRTLLDAADPDWQSYGDMVSTRASDGFVSAFSVEEVAADDNIMVAYAIDGQPLGTQAEGGVGPFRIVIRDDEFGNRSTYWLCRLEVQ